MDYLIKVKSLIFSEEISAKYFFIKDQIIDISTFHFLFFCHSHFGTVFSQSWHCVLVLCFLKSKLITLSQFHALKIFIDIIASVFDTVITISQRKYTIISEKNGPSSNCNPTFLVLRQTTGEFACIYLVKRASMTLRSGSIIAIEVYPRRNYC